MKTCSKVTKTHGSADMQRADFEDGECFITGQTVLLFWYGETRFVQVQEVKILLFLRITPFYVGLLK